MQEQAARGSTFFWLSEPSVRLAEMVVNAVPCAEQVRFVSTGTEATMFACRMARTFTRREKILKFEGGWHGLHDYAMVGNWRVPSEAPYPHPGPDVGGVPRGALESVLVAPFNDLADHRADRDGAGRATSRPSSSSRCSAPSARGPGSSPGSATSPVGWVLSSSSTRW